MDYEKAYKKALEKAREYWKTDNDNTLDIKAKGIMEYLFPELAESEDERIRKEIINTIHLYYGEGRESEGEKMIAWLEKQGEQKPNPYTGTSFEYNGHTWGMCARDNGVEIGFDGELKAFLSSEKSFIYPIHPQPVLEPIKEENVGNNNKVEPKFKVGDWITNGDYTWEITEITVLDYVLRAQNGNIVDDTISYTDKQFNLWTIADAKDGDVLYSPEYKLLWIYKNKEEYYAAINLNYANFTSFGADIEIPSDVCPATKEQCDLLFEKMKEAGYEWNYEKKELKKFNIIDEGKAEMDYCFTKMMNGEKVNSVYSEKDEKTWKELIEEVDLVGKLNGFQNFYAHKNGGEFPSAIEIAEHFYELGLKTKRE